ncbi:hypothetical protein HK096_001400, partial [Nowakowskiella sp. JEL0078]
MFEVKTKVDLHAFAESDFFPRMIVELLQTIMILRNQISLPFQCMLVNSVSESDKKISSKDSKTERLSAELLKNVAELQDNLALLAPTIFAVSKRESTTVKFAFLLGTTPTTPKFVLALHIDTRVNSNTPKITRFASIQQRIIQC